MFWAFGIVTVLYTVVAFVTIGLVDPYTLEGLNQTMWNNTPISLGASKILGRGGAMILAAAALMAFITTASAGIMSASRTLMGMSRDRLLPESLQFLKKESKRFKTPVAAIIATGIFMIAALSAADIKSIVYAASVMKILLFMFVNISVIIMRVCQERGYIQNYKPLYRSPFFPFIQIIGILIYAFLIVQMGVVFGVMPFLITAGFVAFAMSVYLLSVKSNVKRESALSIMRSVEKVVDVSGLGISPDRLDTELRQIIEERDGIKKDDFDALLKRCEILDFPVMPSGRSTSSSEMFKIATQHLSSSTGIEQSTLIKKFRKKELTVTMKPGVVVSHIVVDRPQTFELLLVRSKNGIKFSKAAEPIKAVFVLVGSPDMREMYHLRVIAAIAEIIQSEKFLGKWLQATSSEGIRDLLLLFPRKRHPMTQPLSASRSEGNNEKIEILLPRTDTLAVEFQDKKGLHQEQTPDLEIGENTSIIDLPPSQKEPESLKQQHTAIAALGFAA